MSDTGNYLFKPGDEVAIATLADHRGVVIESHFFKHAYGYMEVTTVEWHSDNRRTQVYEARKRLRLINPLQRLAEI